MMTEYAGKLTPHAKVAVETKIFIFFEANKFSTVSLSDRLSPAWCIPIPSGKSSLRSSFFILLMTLLSLSLDSTRASSIFLFSEFGFIIFYDWFLEKAVSLKYFAVLAVSLLECTKMIIWLLDTLSITFSYKISLINIIFLTPFFYVTPQ